MRTAAGSGEPVEFWRRIETVLDAELAHLDVNALLTELLGRVREELAVDTTAVLLLDPGGGHLVATAACGIEEEVQQGVRVPVGRGFAGRIAAERRPVVLDEVTASSVYNPLLLRRGIRSILGVPLLAGGEVLGVMHAGSLTPRRFTPGDVRFLQLVADRIALEIRAHEALAQRTAVNVLQRSLLPAELPAIAGAELAARYVPGDGAVGGDWYDVFELPSGRVCLVVGDVAGHGLHAAVTMGRLRSVVRAHALDHPDPADLLSKVDEHLHYFERGTLVTALCAVLDPVLRQLEISVAGHPPPAVARLGEPAELLAVAHDVMLGVEPGHRRTTTRVLLPPGTSVCFYTDGLVERRDADLDIGFARLQQAMTTGSAEAVCANVMAELVGRTSVDDDIAILTLSLAAEPAPSDA